MKPSLNNTKVYEVTIRKEKLIFDLSDYSKERFGNSDIVALIVVKYQTASKYYILFGQSLNNVNKACLSIDLKMMWS